MRKVVVNSTPLIALSGINHLEILHKIYGEVFIPNAVYLEISAKPESKCKKDVDNASSWLKIEKIKDEMAKKLYKTQLHEGEVEVMILAQEMSANLAIIDDANAKKHAKYLGITVTGTLGVLIKAKKIGIIPALKPLIENMINNGIYISNDLVKKCLTAVNE